MEWLLEYPANNAGYTNQGVDSIAIRTGAGYSNQGNNSIIINASGTNLSPLSGNGLFINPIRGVNHALGFGVLKFDPATFEIVYSTT